MANLTKKDWMEIYYALESKAVSPTVKGDKKWIAHLNRIMKKIGQEGESMVEGKEESPTRVIVTILGGCFENAYSSKPISFDVLDYDNLSESERKPLEAEIKKLKRCTTH